MIHKVIKYIQEQHMFEAGDYVVAGVSGGADSICLLCVLMELRRTVPVTLHVVHVNHLIRAEAGEDAAYVEQLCRTHEIPFTLVEKDVEALASAEHISVEEAGRQVRYAAFYQVLEENRGTARGRIAVAHNANDSCETFLFNLFRGSGLKGLCGIQASRDELVRPLLCVERAEIEQYLSEKGIRYCIDHTNLEDNYTRNRIRHYILQPACEQISQAAVAHIGEACGRFGEAYALIEELTAQAMENCVKEDERGLRIMREPFLQLHHTIQGYVLLEALGFVAGSRRDIENVHVEALAALMDNQSGKRIDLPYQTEAIREYDGIWLRRRQMGGIVPQREYAVIDEEARCRLEQGETLTIDVPDGTFRFTLFCKKQVIEKEIPIKIYTKWFDYDTINSNVVIRNRRSGDRLTFDGAGGSKTLKAFFIDEKVPRELRDRIYLLAEQEQCLWVVGMRIGSRYKVSMNTRNILQVEYFRRNEDV